MNNAYINGVGKFLPGPPIDNEYLEKYIRPLHHVPSRIKNLALKQNGIKTRHYAINSEGQHEYSNAEMASLAIRDALKHSEVGDTDIEYLASATTIGDLIVPGIASGVHAALNVPPLEIASFHSVCASGIMALKSALMQIKAGEKKVAAVTGSEFSSRWFQPGFYESVVSVEEAARPEFGMEFLRWTLSDGAGAVIVENKPNERKISLKIEWIDLRSYADRFDPCMYAGMSAQGKSWGTYPHPGEAYLHGALLLTQDFKLLYQMFPVWVGYYMEMFDKYQFRYTDIDYFLPHYSANSLREEMRKLLVATGAMVPEEKWFNNLSWCGNTGSASIFIMLEELVNQRKLNSGEKILCFIPESGRCTAAFMMLTVI